MTAEEWDAHEHQRRRRKSWFECRDTIILGGAMVLALVAWLVRR